MKLTVLGMNGPYPAPDGRCSGYFVKSGDTALQMDLGCGTLAGLVKETSLLDLTALVLTHWHNDHCSDVLPLIYALDGLVASGKRKPLPIYALNGTGMPVYEAVKASSSVQLIEVKAGNSFSVGDITVNTFAARHPVPCMMLRLQAQGKVLCYTGDTNVQPGLADYARGADLLLADGLFPMSVWAEQKPHMAAAHCAQLAAEAGAKQLIITHLNPDLDADTLLREAQAVYPTARLAHIGMTADV